MTAGDFLGVELESTKRLTLSMDGTQPDGCRAMDARYGHDLQNDVAWGLRPVDYMARQKFRGVTPEDGIEYHNRYYQSFLNHLARNLTPAVVLSMYGAADQVIIVDKYEHLIAITRWCQETGTPCRWENNNFQRPKYSHNVEAPPRIEHEPAPTKAAPDPPKADAPAIPAGVDSIQMSLF